MAQNELNISIGERIAKLRKEQSLTQEQFAEKLDISIKHCSSVERGISCLSIEKLIDISNLFDVSLDYLIKGTSPLTCVQNYTSYDFPPSILSIIASKDKYEIDLFLEYLRFYPKIRNLRNDT